MTGRMQGKVALVTGAGSGIGRATSLQLAAEGARVVAADISLAGAEETVAQLRAAGGEGRAVRCDVTVESDVEAAVAAAVAAYGRLDCAVNNAGVEGTIAPLREQSAADWQRTIDINLTGVFLSLKHELAVMEPQGSGSIVNISSVLGVVAFATSAAYTASKHGVIGLTKVAALEASPLGVRVNAVCPGFVETPMAERGRAIVGDDVYVGLRQLHAVKRLGEAPEIAESIVWLLSDASSFVTGASIMVDGGFTAQ
jgi:NAD(P)-dependent dehydrogenase (short-subunit alcohol dehydrogenase family)